METYHNKTRDKWLMHKTELFCNLFSISIGFKYSTSVKQPDLFNFNVSYGSF